METLETKSKNTAVIIAVSVIIIIIAIGIILSKSIAKSTLYIEPAKSQFTQAEKEAQTQKVTYSKIIEMVDGNFNDDIPSQLGIPARLEFDNSTLVVKSYYILDDGRYVVISYKVTSGVPNNYIDF